MFGDFDQKIPKAFNASLTNAPNLVINNTQITGATISTGSSVSGTNTGDQTVTDDNSTNSTMSILWSSSTFGTLNAKTSSTKLIFNPSTGIISINAGVNPISSNDLANKGYVDSKSASVSVTLTQNLSDFFVGTYNNGSSGVGATFTLSATGVLTSDGVTVALGNSVLVRNQVSPQNGIYTCTTAGAVGVQAVLTRANNYNTPTLINSTGGIAVLNGNVNSGTTYYLNTPVTTIGTDGLSYTALVIGPTGGGTGLSTYTQGDLLYSNSTNNLTTLAKNNTSTRYLSNQGTSNSPSWSQVNLTNGVTGILPQANGGTTSRDIFSYTYFGGF